MIVIFVDVATQQPEVDEPGSVQYNYQVWRQQQNEHVVEDTEKQAREARAQFPIICGECVR